MCMYFQIWVVGNDITDEEQSKAPVGTLFIPFSLFPPRKVRKDCFYHCVPAMAVPPSLENLHSCEVWLLCTHTLVLHSKCIIWVRLGETSSTSNFLITQNWLPRRVMSAWRIAGIIHSLEGWDEHECGYSLSDIDKVWKASLGHGFRPIVPTTPA